MRISHYCFAIAILLISSCSVSDQAASGKLNVVATTPILGDVVSAIGGENIDLVVLIPPDVDPHAFEPVPQDAARVAEADLVFVNGLGLEGFMQSLIDQAGGQNKVVEVSDGIATIQFQGKEFSRADPHVWMNPLNVKVWADNIASALAEKDPENADLYRANAETYKSQLDELDQWAQEQISQISLDRRILVTDHEALGYFASRYEFQIVGVLVPSYSTQSEPSAGELAALETVIQQYGVRSIFVGVSANPVLAQRVASDTGVNLTPIYSESLSQPGGEASTYLDLIRFDVTAIVEALK